MCTSIVVVAEAFPVQPEMVMDEVTGVLVSGMITFVPFVTGAQPDGGGGVTVPTNSNRFGDPAGSVTLLGVALADSVFHTWPGGAVGVAPNTSAAAPAMCGVAIEVPLMVLVAVSLVCQAEVINWPGAKMSVHEPKFENDARVSRLVVALTVIASATRAGVKLQASEFELPDATA